MDYQMLVLDIDGTLTNSKKEILPETLDALIDIQEQGYKVVLASGRPTHGVLPIAKKLQLERFGNYILSFNGAKIINCHTNKVIYEKTLPNEIVPVLSQAASEFHVGLLTYEDSQIITSSPIDSYIEIESRINNMPIKQVKHFNEYINFKINKCLMTGEPHYLAEVEQKLKSKYNNLLNIFRSEPFFLELMPQKIDKAYTLLKLLNSLGLTKEQMICCGDGFNDISMIECAGLGVAMENAQPLVKEASNYITSSNDENGILHVINKFILKQ